MEVLEEKIIDLQFLFVIKNEDFVRLMKEQCLDTLNAFIKTKANVDHDPFFVREEKDDILFGYVPVKGKENYFCNMLVNTYDDTLSKICLIQFIIFEGCKAYGCYEHIPMVGAPEEEKNAFFFFIDNNIKYIYKIWTKNN